MRFAKFFAAAAAAAFVSTASAQAATFKVEFSGTNGSQFANGQWFWDSAAVGASSDQTNVTLADTGISGFSATIGFGTTSESFDTISFASGFSAGSFDLSLTNGTSDIVNAGTCLQDAGGNGACPWGNPSAILFVNGNGSIGFVLNGVGANVPVSYEVSKVIAPIPLPAGAPLLLTGIAGFAWLRRRKAKQA